MLGSGWGRGGPYQAVALTGPCAAGGTLVMAAVAGGPAAAAPWTLLGADDFGHWKGAQVTCELKSQGRVISQEPCRALADGRWKSEPGGKCSDSLARSSSQTFTFCLITLNYDLSLLHLCFLLIFNHLGELTTSGLDFWTCLIITC